MKTVFKPACTAFFAGILLFILSCTGSEKKQPVRIWYDSPADASAKDSPEGWRNDPEWLKALPVGNGFIGAMVFGDVNSERIQLNEKSLWSGSPDDNNNPEAHEALDRIRDLLFEGKYREASELTLKTQVCKGSGSGHGNGANVPFGCYQTLGDLRLDFGKDSDYKNYHRELDMSEGVVRVSYEQDGALFTREIFASYPDRALVVHLRTGGKGRISFRASLSRPERFEVTAAEDHLMMTGTMKDGKGGEGMKYAARLKAVTDGGDVSYRDKILDVSGAKEVTLILTAATDYKQDFPEYKGDDPLVTTLDLLKKAASEKYKDLLRRHTDDFSALFSKVSLDLSGAEQDTIPTDRRLLNPDDLHLQELYFQFGRYLLISSSRKGSLPANLQGIWANKIQTPWNCDYHTDINVQMNYWPSDATNLSECHEPLTNLIESLVKPGEKTAEVQYHAGGWCVHPITNVWGFTAPGEHPSWGMHVGAGAWLCQHLWDHYTYTMDVDYLKRVYPVMTGSARFYLDWLARDPETGLLVSGPASSPENTFIAPDGSRVQISMGPSHDQEVIHELFTNVLDAASLIGDKDPLLIKIDSALSELALPGIGSDGRLMEWRAEFPEPEPTHRHVSHLYMLHPGNKIDPDRTPGYADAARKSLEVRTDIGTGWSLAWKVNFWARLEDGNRAYKLLKDLLRPIKNYGTNMSDAGGTYQNLFCGHPPFQIDGNFGGTSGMTEMLLQSHIREAGQHFIKVLPALPDAWKNGEVKGLRARGGFEVDIRWKEGKLDHCTVRSLKGGDLAISYNDLSLIKSTAPGETININKDFEFGE